MGPSLLRLTPTLYSANNREQSILERVDSCIYFCSTGLPPSCFLASLATNQMWPREQVQLEDNVDRMTCASFLDSALYLGCNLCLSLMNAEEAKSLDANPEE